jgi:hypothetical protein
MTTLWVPSGVSTVPMTMNGSAVRLCLMICNIYTAEDVKKLSKIPCMHGHKLRFWRVLARTEEIAEKSICDGDTATNKRRLPH